MNEDQSGLYKTISTLGQVVAVAAALLGTPMVYEATKGPLFLYFAKTWGRDLAAYFVLAMGAIEGYLIYQLVALLFTAGVLSLIAKLAMRRFKD